MNNEETKTQERITAGCIVYDSWGYEQTNVDFYYVHEVKNGFAYIQEMKQKTVETGFMSGKTEPTEINPQAKIMRKKIKNYGYDCLSTGGQLYNGVAKSCSWYN